jgi:hypothetical protein
MIISSMLPLRLLRLMLLPLRLLRLLPLPLPLNHRMLLPLPLPLNHLSSSFSWQEHLLDRLP